MAITPSQWSHVLTIPESYTPSAATSGQTLVITESVIAKLSAADQTTFWSNVANGGGDVRICESSDGTNQLPAEIVSLDNAAQTCVIWTRKPTYNGTGDLYLFIGKAGETQPAVTDPFGRNAVWVDYARRVHFDNDLTTDSTGAEAFTNSLTLSAAGVIDEGADFNNGSAFLKSQNTTLPDLSAGLVSLCLWVDFKNLGGFRNRILQLNDNAGGAFVVANGGTDGIFIKKGQRNTKITTGVLVTAPSNGYFKLDIVFDDSQSLELDKYKIYIDNVLQSNVEDTAPFATPGAANDIALGARVSGASSTQSSIDEFGYYSKEKSPDYIATEYNNQSDPAAFYGTPTIAETGGVTGVTADAAYTINAPTFTSSASATLPQPIADASFVLAAPTFTASADATLPQPIADGALSIDSPAFSANMAATLPQPIASAAFTLNSPTFSATADATIPGFNASVSYTVIAPTFTASAGVTLPSPTADAAYTIAAPTFSVSGEVTLPQPSANVALSIGQPTFAATATATEPNFNASVNFALPAPTFSANMAATLPQPIADGNFTITAPTFSVVAIVGGIAIIVDEETNINVPALATNINAPVLSNNVRI